MGLQEIIVAALFLIALIYTARVVYRNLRPKSNCASGCGKCGADFSQIKIPKP